MNDRPTPSLSELQQWFQTVITHPAGVAAGIDEPMAREHIDVAAADVERVIGRSQRLDSIARMGVYSNAYYARLLDCLASDFPALRHAAGEDAFGALAVGYLQQHPSASYTLNQLGARLPQYLSDTRPPRDDEGTPDWADFLINLARLERAYSEVFDGPGEEQSPLLDADSLSEIPPEQAGSVRLLTADSLRLMEFQFPVHEYASQIRAGKKPEPPAPQPTWLAINRREYIVRRRALTRTQFELLRALQSGASLNEAIETAVELGADVDQLSASLGQSFRTWSAAGFFRAITLE